jgi:hypothetical protein
MGETTVSLQQLIDLGRSLGPVDDPIFLYRIAEAQDYLLQMQKEKVNRFCELARYAAKQPRFA